MASKKQQTETVAGQVVMVPLSDVEADFDWNTRSHASILSPAKGADDKENPRVALITSLKDDGQSIPAIARPNTGKGKRLRLVVGFRRYDALTEIHKELGSKGMLGKGKPDEMPAGHILVVIKDLDDKGAVALNVRENAEREDLSLPDKIWGFKKLFDAGFTQEEIAKESGMTQANVSRYNTILKLAPTVFQRWRESTKPLTVPQIIDVAKETGEAAQKAKFDALWKVREPSSGGGGATPDPNAPPSWVKRIEGEAKELGESLATLEFHRVISGINEGAIVDAIDKLISFPGKAERGFVNTQGRAVAKAYAAKLHALQHPPAPKQNATPAKGAKGATAN